MSPQHEARADLVGELQAAANAALRDGRFDPRAPGFDLEALQRDAEDGARVLAETAEQGLAGRSPTFVEFAVRLALLVTGIAEGRRLAVGATPT